MALLLEGTGITAGRTPLTGGTIGPRLGALTGPTHPLTPAATQQTDAGHLAGVGARGAVAVLSFPVRVTLAEATVTLAVL